MRRVLLLSVACAFASLADAHRAHADEPRSLTGSYSRYEQETIDAEIARLGGKIDPNAEGKTIERIEIVSLEVIEPRDPIPELVNALHATTRPYVIEREVLLARGEAYRKVLADETARNLRRLPQLSLVVCVPVEGSTRDSVRLVVITKDVWSLRLAFDLKYSAGGLESLLVEPTETNIAGTQQTALARFTLNPDRYSLGATYRIPRLEGLWLAFVADANIYLNRHTGQPEGSYGSASIGRPLYSTRTEWAWSDGVAWHDEIKRRYADAHLVALPVTLPSGTVVDVPYEYRSRSITDQVSVTRSFGWAVKNDFTFGAEMNRRSYETPPALAQIDPAAVAQFVTKALPVSDTRVGPFAQWRGYKTDFLRILDFESLGLQEDYRLGHDVWLRVYPVTSALGSSRTFVGTYAAAQYTVAAGDGFARASVESTVEAETERLSDAAIGGNVRIVTPRLGFGRVVLDGAALNRYRNYLNQTTFLGGDTRLRGFPTSAYVGKDVVALNVEYRSRPLEVLGTWQLGGAAFYDVGDAFNGFDDVRLKHAVGVGVRALFPSLDRLVFRADLGFPVYAPAPRPGDLPYSPVSFFVAFSQAFPIESVGGVAASGGIATSPTVGGMLGQ